MQKTSEDEIERRRKEAAKRALEEAKLRKESADAAALSKELGAAKAPNPRAMAIGRRRGLPRISNIRHC